MTTSAPSIPPPTPPPFSASPTSSQCSQYFGNDKKYICSPRGECRLPTGQFQLFLSCDCSYRRSI